MRTIETIATVSPDGTLMLQLPPDVLPGSHHMVLVINEQVITDLSHLPASKLPTLTAETTLKLLNAYKADLSDTDAKNDSIWQLGSDPIVLGIPDAASNLDQYLYHVE